MQYSSQAVMGEEAVGFSLSLVMTVMGEEAVGFSLSWPLLCDRDMQG